MTTILANVAIGALAMALLFVVFALWPAAASSCGGCDGCTGSCGADPGTCPLDDFQQDLTDLEPESFRAEPSPPHIRWIPEVSR